MKCPCGSGQAYATCCEPYHLGEWPKQALQLMRSRYAAYALHLTDYIERTTHPQNEQFNREGLKPFCEQTEFLGLDILDVQEGEASATVTFTAHLAQAGRDASFTEKSLFEKVKGQWMYRAGC